MSAATQADIATARPLDHSWIRIPSSAGDRMPAVRPAAEAQPVAVARMRVGYSSAAYAKITGHAPRTPPASPIPPSTRPSSLRATPSTAAPSAPSASAPTNTGFRPTRSSSSVAASVGTIIAHEMRSDTQSAFGNPCAASIAGRKTTGPL